MWRKQQEERQTHDFDDSVDSQSSKTKTPFGYEDPFSWEEQAFAEDAAGRLGGCVWPPRSYSCSFCRREFRSAQALGGHMNVHRRDRARLKQSPSTPNHNPFTNSFPFHSPSSSSSSSSTFSHHLPTPKPYLVHPPPPNRLTSKAGKDENLTNSCTRVRDNDHAGIGILDDGLNFSFGPPWPTSSLFDDDSGREEAGVDTSCKKRKTDCYFIIRQISNICFIIIEIYLRNMGAALAYSPTKLPPPFLPKLASSPDEATLPTALLAKIGSFAQCGDSSGFNIVFVPCSRFPLLLLGVRNILTRAKAASSLSDNPSSWVRHILAEAKAASPLSGDPSAIFDDQEPGC